MNKKMESQKLILIADNSPTNIAIFQNLLEAKGYKTVSVNDGFTALTAITENKPDVVAFSSTLSVYDGFQMARILSTSKQFCTIPIVVFAFENTSVYDFWTKNTGTDIFCPLKDNNLEKLCESIENALKIDKTDRKKQLEVATPVRPKDILKQSYSRDLFDLYVTRTTLEAGMYLRDMDTLVKKMIKLLSGICGYDATCLIINDHIVNEYFDISEELSESEKKDFFTVSEADFKTFVMNNRPYETKKIAIVPGNIVARTDYNFQKSNSLKLQSYTCFKLETSLFLGSLHIGHTQADYFNGRIQERCIVFVEKLTQLLEQLLYIQRIDRAEKTMKKAFSRFVPEQMINDLVKTGNAYNDTLGENRKVAILICDIRNFTDISELNDPEIVVAFLNHYFSIMCEVIKKHGGTIDKFMGDAIMALFGATVSYKDNTRRAVESAIEMRQKLLTIDTSKLTFPAGIKFDMGIGIHYGNVIVGSIGSKDKSDFTVIGDTVNLTSRIESLNKQYGTKILITDSVYKSLDSHFSIRQIDQVKVKGKSNSVKIYSIENPLKKFPDEYLDNYKKALNAYTIGGWRLAAEYFEKALYSLPEESVANVLYNRCKEYIKKPPKNWDGAVKLTTK